MQKRCSCPRIFRESSAFVYLIRLKTAVTFSANIMQFFSLLIQSAQFWHAKKDVPFPLIVIHLFGIKRSPYTEKKFSNMHFPKFLQEIWTSFVHLLRGFTSLLRLALNLEYAILCATFI